MNQSADNMPSQKSIPALRFPEFADIWSEVALGEIARFSKGKGISKADIDISGGLECIRYGELYTIYTEIIDKVQSRTNVSADQLVLSEPNDVIIPASGETQIDIATASCVLREGIALSGDLNIIKSSVNGVFLSYYLNNARKKDIASLAQGISVVHLYASQLKLLILNLPQAAEQQKIASFLTAVDKRIQLLQKKKEQLETYKKGVMQKVFSQELRFKDENDQDFPDWEEKRLGEVCEIKGGKRIPKGYSLQDNNNGFPYITVSDMTNGSVCLEGIKYVPVEIVDKIKSYRISIDDLFVSVAGTLGLVGIIPEELDDANLTENANKLTKLKCNKHFLYYLLNSQSFYRLIESVKTTNAQPKLAIYALKSFDFLLPSPPEQQKIASFLSAIDESIEKVGRQIENTIAFKKGLLQKMFV